MHGCDDTGTCIESCDTADNPLLREKSRIFDSPASYDTPCHPLVP
jgi:hypothetical protein